MQLALLSLLIVIVALLVMRAVTRERREYAQFKRLRATDARQKVYAKWLRESFFLFGGLTAAVLLAAWPYVPAVLADARTSPPLDGLVAIATGDFGAIITLAAATLFAVALVLPVLLLRSTMKHDTASPTTEVPAVGDISALLPRTRGELRYGVGLSLNAGIVEELLFRFALPALLFGIVGNGAAAFLLASILFGLLHLYQGRTGVIVTTLLGALLSLVYILSGSILVVIVVHALIDLRSLVLIPIVVQRVGRKPKPDPEPTPAPAPKPDPEPKPDPAPKPDPKPDEAPEPTPAPDPAPASEPTPEPSTPTP